MNRLKFATLLVAVALSYGFQAPEGTAASCNNMHGTSPAHRCSCAKAMMECKTPGAHAEPDAKCKTFCEPSHCHCAGPACTSRH